MMIVIAVGGVALRLSKETGGVADASAMISCDRSRIGVLHRGKVRLRAALAALFLVSGLLFAVFAPAAQARAAPVPSPLIAGSVAASPSAAQSALTAVLIEPAPDCMGCMGSDCAGSLQSSVGCPCAGLAGGSGILAAAPSPLFSLRFVRVGLERPALPRGIPPRPIPPPPRAA